MQVKCKHEYYDNYFGEVFCKVKSKPCHLAYDECKEKSICP